MRRVIVAVVAAGMLLVPSSVSATGARDYAKGSGTLFTGTQERTFALNAWSDPAGNDPEGSIKLETSFGTYFATVTCLSVVGNVAVIWGDVTHTSTGAFPVEAWRFTFVDHSADTTVVPDEAAITNFPDSPPAGVCGPPADFIFPLERGQVTVFDE